MTSFLGLDIGNPTEELKINCSLKISKCVVSVEILYMYTSLFLSSEATVESVSPTILIGGKEFYFISVENLQTEKPDRSRFL